jgi:hypothetical protein
MSTPSEVKIRLDPSLKKQFDQLCREAGTTMTSEISHLISAAIEKNAEQPDAEAVPPVPPEAAADEEEETVAEPEPTATEILVERFDELLTWIESAHAGHPRNWFEQWFKVRAQPELMAIGKRHGEHAQALGNAATSLANLQKSIDRVESNTRVIQPRFYQDYRIWTAVAGGALALVLMLALLPGETGLSRFLARKIIGGKNDVHAAGIMAGGDSFAGQLIYETSALMKTVPFANDYARCVERAKTAKKVTRCTLTFPALLR